MGKEGNGCDAELLSMKEREGKGRGGLVLGCSVAWPCFPSVRRGWGIGGNRRASGSVVINLNCLFFYRGIKIHSNIVYCSRRRK
jgi:hypothetical protein